MYRIGIDVGSSFTKYCVMEDEIIRDLFSEKTPVRQKDYFDRRIMELNNRYPECSFASCGYGKSNISGMKRVNELIALAKGVDFFSPQSTTVLDIGGQDTKIIKQEKGVLKEFFVNDKCAAGSGMFLTNTCNLLGINLMDIKLMQVNDATFDLSSVCAVFAQSEIVELVSKNISEDIIVMSVLKHIFQQARKLLNKVDCDKLLLSGGLSNIEDINEFATTILRKKCVVVDYSNYLSAVGCALLLES